MNELRAEVATACRILAREGLVQGALGHVSARVPGGMLLRCRGPEEAGVRWTEPSDVVVCDLDGRPVEPTEHRPPSEHPIHGAVYRARSDVGAVVHAHPPAVLACNLAGVPLRPIFGAYNIPAYRLAREGVPVLPSAGLVRRPDLAAAMVAALSDGPTVVLRGHGVVVVGATVQAATVRTLDLEVLARVCLEVAQAGGQPADIAHADDADLPDLGAAFDDDLAWAYHNRADALARHAEEETTTS